MNLDHILNWELKSGSHKFPGPNGGTCINEAAIVAAGFEYRKVGGHRDCPPCFCPVLSAFSIAVNDFLPDQTRNRLLMPLVTRLVGSKGEPWVDRARANFLMSTINEACVTRAMYGLTGMIRNTSGPEIGRLELAKKDFARAANPDYGIAPEDRSVGQIEDYMSGLANLTRVLRVVGRVQWMPRPEPMKYELYEHVSETITFTPEFATASSLWELAAQQLTRAFEIGPRAPDIDAKAVVTRMEAAKATARREHAQ